MTDAEAKGSAVRDIPVDDGERAGSPLEDRIQNEGAEDVKDLRHVVVAAEQSIDTEPHSTSAGGLVCEWMCGF